MVIFTRFFEERKDPLFPKRKKSAELDCALLVFLKVKSRLSPFRGGEGGTRAKVGDFCLIRLFGGEGGGGDNFRLSSLSRDSRDKGDDIPGKESFSTSCIHIFFPPLG